MSCARVVKQASSPSHRPRYRRRHLCTTVAMRLLSSPVCGPAAMLLMSARPGVITRMAAGLPEFAVRPAKWPDDYDAVCAVRKPTEFVVEDGGAGFMGQRVAIVDPEEAQQRRVQARLASALRDNATVLLVEDPPGGGALWARWTACGSSTPASRAPRLSPGCCCVTYGWRRRCGGKAWHGS